MPGTTRREDDAEKPGGRAKNVGTKRVAGGGKRAPVAAKKEAVKESDCIVATTFDPLELCEKLDQLIYWQQVNAYIASGRGVQEFPDFIENIKRSYKG